MFAICLCCHHVESMMHIARVCLRPCRSHFFLKAGTTPALQKSIAKAFRWVLPLALFLVGVSVLGCPALSELDRCTTILIWRALPSRVPWVASNSKSMSLSLGMKSSNKLYVICLKHLPCI